MGYNIYMFSDPQNTLTLSPSLLRDVAHAMQAFDAVKDDVRNTLKIFPIADMIKMRMDAAKQVETLMQPRHEYCVPQPVAYVPETEVYARTVVSLCFDIKYREIYEHDNRKHNHIFSDRASQQFKILHKLSEKDTFITTKELMVIGGYKSSGSTYKAIEKINAIGFKIGLPSNLLESSQGEGFRINPDFRISVV